MWPYVFSLSSSVTSSGSLEHLSSLVQPFCHGVLTSPSPPPPCTCVQLVSFGGLEVLNPNARRVADTHRHLEWASDIFREGQLGLQVSCWSQIGSGPERGRGEIRPGKVQDGKKLNSTRLESGPLVHLLQNIHGNWKAVYAHGKSLLASLDGPLSGHHGTLFQTCWT